MRETMWKEFIPKSWILVRRMYTWALFKQDLLAGVTVGVVALPLAMAFAIASGVLPEQGLYTAIIAGFLISFFGGSRYQISGPTGAFVVILYGIIQSEGYGGLVAAGLLAGVLLIIASLLRLGSLIRYIPYPLVTGFTTGIAVVIFSSQVVDFLGLHVVSLPVGFLAKWRCIICSLPSWDFITTTVSLGTLILMLGIRRFAPKWPWGILAVSVMTLICFIWHLPVATIASRFGEITPGLPMPSFPSLTISSFSTLITNACTIAFLAGIESLLSAVVADGMTGARHKSNCELMAQGIGNIGSLLFGGIPATGAIARTATNVKTGAKTPIAGMIHAITLLAILVWLTPLVSQIPLAALSALLIMVAWNMAEVHVFCHLLKSPKDDILLLWGTFLLTVLVDLTVAVGVGMIFSAFIFMKKVSTLPGLISPTQERSEEFPLQERREVGDGIEVYDILGPFLFGMADHLRGVLSGIERPPKVFILRLHKVPIIDASGMQAIIDLYNRCQKEKIKLFLSGVRDPLWQQLQKFKVLEIFENHRVFSRYDEALREAKILLKE